MDGGSLQLLCLPGPCSPSPLPPAASRGSVWHLEPPTCAGAPKAMEGPFVTKRMTPAAPAQPSNVTRDSATSQIEGSPTACASPALVGSTVNKVGPLCAWEGGPQKDAGVRVRLYIHPWLEFQVQLCHLEAVRPSLSHLLSLRVLRLEYGSTTIPSCMNYPWLHKKLAPNHSSSELH